MAEREMIKNIPHAQVVTFTALIDYKEGQVVSRTIAQTGAGSMTLFAFAKGEGLSAHAANGDALVWVLDGSAEITIDTEVFQVGAGKAIVMPANISHALQANEPFKMLLSVVMG